MGFQALAAGMAAIHSKGLVDQDVHAGNVLLSSDGCTWVKADLGNAVWTRFGEMPAPEDICL